MTPSGATGEDRVCLPRCDWPPAIRDRFEQVFHAGDRPRRRSAGGKFPRATSIEKYEWSLGRFVGHLRRAGLERPGAEMIDYLDDACRETYLETLLACGLSDQTIFGRFEDLRIIAGWLYPKQPLPAIMRIHGMPLKHLLPMESHGVPPPSREAIIAWCQELFTNALTLTGLWRWLQVRDAAMFAILASLGPRRGSLQLMQIGLHLRQRLSGGSWWLNFTPGEVKHDADYGRQLDRWTWPIIERYLAVERVELLGKRHSTAIWIGRGGGQIGAANIWHIVHTRSLKRFGVAYSVHMFRHHIATAGMCDGEEALRDASERLGHRSLDMTMGYVHGSAITAISERHTGMIDAAMGKDRLTLERVFPEEAAAAPPKLFRKRPQRRSGRRQLDMFALLQGR